MFEKCLHGKTQNANESFNGMMVFDTTAHCNNDEKDALDIMELLGIHVITWQSVVDLSICVVHVIHL